MRPRSAEKPKVVIVAAMGPQPWVRGVENVVHSFLESQLPDRFRIQLFDTFNRPDPQRSPARKLWNALALFLRAFAYFVRERPQIVHCHMAGSVTFWRNALCLGAARLARRETILQLHAPGFDDLYYRSSRLWRFAVRQVFRRAHLVIALSDHWARFISQVIVGTRVRVLPNPIVVSRFRPAPRARRGKTVVLVGSVGHRKGHYDVVSVIPLIRVSHPDVRFLFAGDEDTPGAQRDLARIAHDLDVAGNLRFLGPIDRETMRRLLQNATAMILPSYAENLPLSVMEGMAAGLPVVASRVGGIPEMIDDGRSGLLIDPGDRATLAKHLTELLHNDEMARRLGMRAQERAAEWDIAIVAERLGTIYEELLGSSWIRSAISLST